MNANAAPRHAHAGPRAVAIAAVAGAALILTSCSGGGSTPDPSVDPGGQNGSVPAGDPVSGGRLVIGLQADPNPLNPNLTTNGPTQQLGTMIYEPLVYFDNESAEPEGVLAESWEISEDGLTYEFNLVDAAFSDGEPLTSTDVKYTIEEVSSPYFPQFAQAAAVIDEIDDSDPDTVVIHLSQPFGPFLTALCRVWILPEHVFGDSDPTTHPASIDEPVGTGPFLLDSFTRGSQWTLVRNPDYWQADRPYLDTIVGRVLPDAQSASLALSGGEIQYISSQVISPNDIQTLVDTGRAVSHPDSFAPNVSQVFFNVEGDITGDVEVRHALAMAIDREFLLENIFAGNGDVARGPFDSRIEWAFNDDVDFNELYPYDPEAAAAALDAAGYPVEGGSRFSIDIVVEGASRLQPVAEALRSMYAEIDVNASVVAPEASIALDQSSTGDFDLFIQSYTTNWDPALGIERAFVTSQIDQAFGNVSRYSNPEVDQLFEQGRLKSLNEDRAIPYQQAQAILAEDLPVMPLIETKLLDGAAPNVHGIWYAANWGQWQEAWVGE